MSQLQAQRTTQSHEKKNGLRNAAIKRLLVLPGNSSLGRSRGITLYQAPAGNTFSGLTQADYSNSVSQSQ